MQPGAHNLESIEPCAEDVAALREMAREFTEGFNSGDVDRLMRFYGSSYVDINLRGPVQSHEERRAYYAQVMRKGVRVRVHPDEIVVRGDMAFVRGRIEVFRPGAAASVPPAELRYLEILRKEPDGWKSMWGMDGPVQEYDPGQDR